MTLQEFAIEKMKELPEVWWNRPAQSVMLVHVASEILIHHADKVTPEQAVELATRLNNAIYKHLPKGK